MSTLSQSFARSRVSPLPTLTSRRAYGTPTAPVMVGIHKLKRIRFGEFLVERQALDDEQLLDALALHWERGCRIGDAVCARGYLARDAVENFAVQYRSLRTVLV